MDWQYWKNLLIFASGIIFIVALGLTLADENKTAEAKTKLENGCATFSTAGSNTIYRCYDDVTNQIFYTNSVGFISRMEP